MNSKMPCHITDGPQLPEDIPVTHEADEDWAYDTWRQKEMDEQAEYEEAMLGMDEWRLKVLHKEITGRGLTITKLERDKTWT